MTVRRRFVICALGSLSLFALFGALNAGGAIASASTSANSWTEYHGDPTGSGEAAGITSVSTSTPAWRSAAVDGQLYGQPLGFGASIFVATENDTVYALNATTGAVTWSAHVGTPVSASSLPCGNISPTVGITGTPVIDTAKGELFVVADELINGAPRHELIGIATATGTIELNQNIDPSGSDPAALLQRTGLALDAGRVVFGFGGNYGDCGSYRGWVVSVPEGGGAPKDFAVDSGASERQGAIWMGGGAPAIDAGGNIWVSAGNGSVTSSSQPYDNSDSVLELSPSLTVLQYFAPTSWASDNSADKDFSSTPALLSDGQVVIAGKSRIVYLLNGTHLGGIGGQEAAISSGCGDDIDGGMAVVGSVVFLPCLTGTEALQTSLSPAAENVSWNSGVGGGPPIVAAGEVWTIGQNGELYGLNPINGKVEQSATVGRQANHFPTPGIAADLLVVPTANTVVAFTASSSATAGPTTTSTTTTATTSSTSSTSSTSNEHTTTTMSTTPSHLGGSAGGLPAWGIAAIVVGVLALAGAVAAGFRRRAKRHELPGALTSGAGESPE